jgi:hypothetical protein
MSLAVAEEFQESRNSDVGSSGGIGELVRE